MDPNANLEEQRKLAADILRQRDMDLLTSPDDVARLCELMQAMDTWLEKGGALPKDWQKQDKVMES